MCLQPNSHQGFKQRERQEPWECAPHHNVWPQPSVPARPRALACQEAPIGGCQLSSSLTCSSPSQRFLGDCTSLRSSRGFQQGPASSQAGCRSQATAWSSTPKVWQFDLDEFRAGTVYCFSRDHIPSAQQPLLMWALPKWTVMGLYTFRVHNLFFIIILTKQEIVNNNSNWNSS